MEAYANVVAALQTLNTITSFHILAVEVAIRRIFSCCAGHVIAVNPMDATAKFITKK